MVGALLALEVIAVVQRDLAVRRTVEGEAAHPVDAEALARQLVRSVLPDIQRRPAAGGLPAVLPEDSLALCSDSTPSANTYVRNWQESLPGHTHPPDGGYDHRKHTRNHSCQSTPTLPHPPPSTWRRPFAARVVACTEILDMVPRSARLSFVAGSVAVIADASALAVVAYFICTAQGFQQQGPPSNVYAET